MSANIINNSAILNAASTRIDELDAALARYDALGEQRTKLQADLKNAEDQEELILNDEGLDYNEGA